MRDYRRAEAQYHPSAAVQALCASGAEAAHVERDARLAGIVRIERGPAAYRITFPKLSAAERGTPAAKQAWEEARRPMSDTKSIAGRRFDAMASAWIVPLSQSAAIEGLALNYATSIEDAAIDSPAAARIVELERQLAELEAAYADALAHDCRAVLQAVAS